MRQPVLPHPVLPTLDDLPEGLIEQRQCLDEAMYACCMSIRGLLIVGAETFTLRGALPDSPDRVVLSGLMVRCYKLYDSLVFLALDGRHETALILLRALVDTVVNLTYISRASDSAAAAEAFIRSARARDIEGRKEHRGPASFVAPGEDRVVGSTLRHLASSGLAAGPISASDKWWSGPGGSKERAKSAGLLGMYHHSFAAGSRAVHGDWGDLVAFHLVETEDGTFIPHLDYRGMQLALLEVASSLAIAGLREEALSRAPESRRQAFADLLEWLDEWLQQFDTKVVPASLPNLDLREHQKQRVQVEVARLTGHAVVSEEPDGASASEEAVKRKAATDASITEWSGALCSSLFAAEK